MIKSKFIVYCVVDVYYDYWVWLVDLLWTKTYLIMSKKGHMICYGVVGGIGVILIIVSMAGFAYFPPLIESQVFDNLDITNHESEGYKNFVSR